MRWLGACATGFALLWVLLAIWAWTRNFHAVNFTDYISYWAAGKLALGGHPADAYDVAVHRATEFTITRFPGLLPFPYPPPFLLLVTPFSTVPYMWGFAGFILLTTAIYAVATRRMADANYAFAQPAVFINGIIGQNGFLTAGVFAAGTAMLRERPYVAGAILGTLVIKPQLALLLPVAVIASREWRAIAGAAVSGGLLLLLALILFGLPAYEGFFRMGPLYTELMRQDKWPWNEFISIFAFVRYFGVGQGIALTVHAVVALGAIALTWIAWAREWPSRVPVLAAATLLVPPYLLTYDALLLVVPMGFWTREQRRPWLVALLWFLCVLPIAFYFNFYRGPNTTPLAAILALGVFALDRRRTANVDHADLV